jgi:hypothetical protein
MKGFKHFIFANTLVPPNSVEDNEAFSEALASALMIPLEDLNIRLRTLQGMLEWTGRLGTWVEDRRVRDQVRQLRDWLGSVEPGEYDYASEVILHLLFSQANRKNNYVEFDEACISSWPLYVVDGHLSTKTAAGDEWDEGQVGWLITTETLLYEAFDESIYSENLDGLAQAYAENIAVRS